MEILPHKFMQRVGMQELRSLAVIKKKYGEHLFKMENKNKVKKEEEKTDENEHKNTTSGQLQSSVFPIGITGCRPMDTKIKRMRASIRVSCSPIQRIASCFVDRHQTVHTLRNSWLVHSLSFSLFSLLPSTCLHSSFYLDSSLCGQKEFADNLKIK